MPERQIDQVVEDQHLAIAIRPGADADGWRFDLGRDHGRDFARNAFEINASHAGAIERNRIAHELLDRVQRLALNLVAAHDVDRLRREPDVSGDGNLGVDHAADHVHALLAAFHLDRLGAAFFHKAGGIVNGFVRGRPDKTRKACRR